MRSFRELFPELEESSDAFILCTPANCLKVARSSTEALSQAVSPLLRREDGSAPDSKFEDLTRSAYRTLKKHLLSRGFNDVEMGANEADPVLRERLAQADAAAFYELAEGVLWWKAEGADILLPHHQLPDDLIVLLSQQKGVVSQISSSVPAVTIYLVDYDTGEENEDELFKEKVGEEGCIVYPVDGDSDSELARRVTGYIKLTNEKKAEEAKES
jgi:hypothetical protein